MRAPKRQLSDKFLITAMTVFVFVVAILSLLLAIFGCDGGDYLHRVAWSTAPDDPSAYSGTVVGFYAKSEDHWGEMWVNAVTDSTINAVAILKGWTSGPIGTRFIHFQTAYDLRINPDSTVSGKYLGAWVRDSSSKVYNMPMPAIGTLNTSVTGTFRTDSLFLYQVRDTTTGQFVNVYQYLRLFNLTVRYNATYFSDGGGVSSKMQWIGPPHQSTGAGGDWIGKEAWWRKGWRMREEGDLEEDMGGRSREVGRLGALQPGTLVRPRPSSVGSVLLLPRR